MGQSGAPDGTALLTIDLGAIAANWRRLADRSAPAECSAVVKADAYGLGLEPVMRALLGAGCRTFFVATLAEAERARNAAKDATIYVLDGLALNAAARLKAANLRPVLNSLAEMSAWIEAGAGPAALHFDTGMNRLGVAPEDAAKAASRCAGFTPSLLMSHFFAGSNPDHPGNARQIAALAALRDYFLGVPASLAHSSGIFLPQRPVFDLTRPGYALYGGNPTPGYANPMLPVVRLQARILATREIGPGESVGYDATWIAQRPTRLATIGVGYADGLPIAASSRAEAMVGGRRCPVVGRVSMDLTVLDVTDSIDAKRGDVVELLGETIGIDDLAKRAGTIGYEILTRLGARYARRYVGG